MTKQILVGFILLLPVYLLAVAHLVPALAMKPWMHGTASRWLQSAFTAPMVWWTGWLFFRRHFGYVMIGVPS